MKATELKLNDKHEHERVRETDRRKERMRMIRRKKKFSKHALQ